MIIKHHLKAPASIGEASQDEQSQIPKVLVGLFGASKSGKTSFIDKVIDKVTDYEETTGNESDLIREHHLTTQGIDFTLIEFPAFTGVQADDESILHVIAEWLKDASASGRALTGYLYFHRIIDNRKHGLDLMNLKIFKALCSADKCLENTVVVTTWWDQEEEQMAKARERALRKSHDFWGDMINNSTRLEKLPSDRRKCINLLLSMTKLTSVISNWTARYSQPVAYPNAAEELKYYRLRHAVRAAEELERLAEKNYYDAERQKLSQRVLARVADQEKEIEEHMTAVNADDDVITLQKAGDELDPELYRSMQVRRLALFERQRMLMTTQDQGYIRSEMKELEDEHILRVAELDKAKLERRATTHRESLNAQWELLEEYNAAKKPQRTLKYLELGFSKVFRHEQEFCYHCLNQVSLFDRTWSGL